MIHALILAGGKGSRMKTNIPKCIYPFHNKPMINYLIDTFNKLNINDISIITGHEETTIKKTLSNYQKINYIYQKEQLGTANAVKQSIDYYTDKEGYIIIIPADMPLVNDEILIELINKHINSNSTITMITNILDNPTGYGRILRDKNNEIIKIIEELETDFNTKLINEINTGIYIIDINTLINNIDKIKNNNNKKEYYLTDLIEIISQKEKISSITYHNEYRLQGINNLKELANLENMYQQHINNKLMLEGVQLIKPETIIIEDTVRFESNVIIDAYCILRGNTVIKKNTYIPPFTYIKDDILIKK